MRRRDFLKAGGAAAAGFLAAAKPVEAAPEATRRPERRPNILWITCEDMSPHLGCYGDRTVPTPNIDRLARDGVRYTHAFTTTAVCGPSRHGLITGMYPTSTYAMHMRNRVRTGALEQITDTRLRDTEATRPLYEAVPPPEVRCLTEYLRLAGYYCSNNSKEDYQFLPPPTAWDDSSGKAHWRNRRAGQPFFSVFNYTVTHESGVFGEGRSPKVVDPAKVTVPPYYPDTPVVRADIAKIYDNIAALDASVGALLAELEKDGLLDDTIVFFFSDHGDGLPRSKRWVYDSGTHVPFIVRHPDGSGAGSTSSRLVSFIDFLPSVLSLAGVEVPGHVRGVPFLGSQAGPECEFVFFHRDRNGENLETIRAVRDRRFRYVRNYRPDEPYIKPLAYRDQQAIMQELNRAIEKGTLSADQWQFAASAKPMEEFYDTQNDPFEIHNLASDPSHAERMSRMRRALQEWTAVCNDPLDMPEDEMVRTRVYPPDGKQPETAAPEARLESLAGGRVKLTVTCATPGASIGYRIRRGTGEGAGGPWSVYNGSVEIPSASVIEVIAHRIGFKPSEVVIVPA